MAPIDLVPPAEAARVTPAVAQTGPASRKQWLLAIALLLTTFCTATTLGGVWHLATRTDVQTGLELALTPRTVVTVWQDAELLLQGLAFSVPVLLILLCHELGHYLTCRVYGLPATPPYFIPAPLGIGTFGAFIRIRAPISGKRQLFDVGISGPLAGFVALLPFLFYGVAHSRVVGVDAVPPELATGLLPVPGTSLALWATTILFHGRLPAGAILELHPAALAAWVGLLATSLNLLPLGQLDGGHILYAATGRLQHRLAWPLWVALALAGLLYWRGWLVWCAILLVIRPKHPPLTDEQEPLDPRRRALSLLALLLFLATFMPEPLVFLTVP